MNWKSHGFRVGTYSEEIETLPDVAALSDFIEKSRKRIEPWLSAVFQSEHLNLLIGSGFTLGLGFVAGATVTGMGAITIGSDFDKPIAEFSEKSAKEMKRGSANIEDYFRTALAIFEGLRIYDPESAAKLREKIDEQLTKFLVSLLTTEIGIKLGADATRKLNVERLLQSFLLSFASRAASRERLHIFTLNYDRLLEHGCDLAGIRIIDRFVGALSPVFRSSRIEMDVHYNPPGIRGEPRFMEGVIKLTKLHGSLDWHFDPTDRLLRRKGIPFGSGPDHSEMPKNPIDTVMIYPNAAKDVETTQYPYAELFRDFAASICRPNAVIVTYGYGFGDDHVNRVLIDMLTIPSTHLVIIAYAIDGRIKAFCDRTRDAQVTLLFGSHFGNIENLVSYYLPKPALDFITGRMTDLLKRRPDTRGELEDSGVKLAADASDAI
jgi:hypothetical protein